MKILLLFSLILFSSCSTFNNEQDLPLSEAVTIKFSEETYAAGDEVRFSVSNSGHKPVYKKSCSTSLIYIEQKIDKKWTSYAGGICNGLISHDFHNFLEPGESTTLSIQIQEAGIYRVGLILKYFDNEEENLSRENFTWSKEILIK